MTEKQKYIGAFLDGYFSDKKIDSIFAFFKNRKDAEKQAKKRWKQYKKQTI